MRHFAKYVLVAAVILFGFHTASRFKAPSEHSAASVAESEAAALSLHPEAQPTDQPTDWQVPVAALDGDRPASGSIEPESRDEFQRPVLKGQPTIDDASRFATPSVIEDWSGRESPWWGREPSGGGTPDYEKSKVTEEPASRQKTPGEETHGANKGRGSHRSPATGKARDGKKKKGSRPAGLTGSHSSASANDDPWALAESSGTPKWPVGERLASSTTSSHKKGFGDPSWKDGGGSRQDAYRTSARRPSPFERDCGEEQDIDSSSQGDDGMAFPDRGDTQQRRKPVQPSNVEPRLRTANTAERHRIVAGDTLPKLAAAYLGDRDRYLDIFQANQDVLTDPRLLPIGIELTIPSGAKGQSLRRHTADSTGGRHEIHRRVDDDMADGHDQMVPIPTFALPARMSR